MGICVRCVKSGGHGQRKRKHQKQSSLQTLAQCLNLIIRKRPNPKTSLYHARHGLQRVSVTRVNQTQKAFDNPGRCAVSLKVDQCIAVGSSVHVVWLLRIVRKVMDIKAFTLK